MKRNEASVIQDQAFGLDGSKLPDERAVFGTETIGISIIAAKEDTTFGECRRRSDRTVSDVRPSLAAVGRINSIQSVISRRSKENIAADCDWLKAYVITSHRWKIAMASVRIPFRRPCPCGLRRRRRAPAPCELQFIDVELVSGVARAAHVMLKRWPLLSSCRDVR